MAKQYKLYEGSIQHQFQQSRNKIQIFGGGFGNGKTTSAVIKALEIAKNYPGSNGLLARATYPKLNDTLRKEFLSWCPAAWIESKNLSTDNVVRLKNGSVINFRYISQQGRSEESSTSNLLSATYDYIVVDQMEDPEISHKDFLDLMGRLRGNARYIGDDPTMPVTGPRWFIITLNPTRNWVYRELIKPLHDYRNGRHNTSLITDADGLPLIDLFEGSTYTNKENLPEDFIQSLESTYKGQMRERFLMGQWGAFEGLVYPQYDAQIHMLPHGEIVDYLREISYRGYMPRLLEAYDHGLAQPACYGQAFVDFAGNVFVLSGFYEKEMTVSELAHLIKQHRARFSSLSVYPPEWQSVLADPSVFKRATANSKKIGTTVAKMFAENGVDMAPANNAIMPGIMQVQSYLAVDMSHRHPLRDVAGSPRLFFSDELDFIDKEFVDYIWKRNTSGEFEDQPRDAKDHAMDMIKYMLSRQVKVAPMVAKSYPIPSRVMQFHEHEIGNNQNMRSHRYGT
jgi:phage terminase large subunit